jgi:hypothetical protein
MPIRPENRDKYPLDWAEISKRIRFERAGGQCEFEDEGVRCEARRGFQHPITKSLVVLTTMHLDHNPENCTEENLKAACQMHHNAYDRPHRNETRARTMRDRKQTLELFTE